jgi:Concanavalin A-like lectin/glucanases superfamily
LKVRLTDAGGALLQGVTLRAVANGIELNRRTDLWNETYPLTVLTTAKSVDLEATGPKDLGGWRVGVPLPQYGEQTVDWQLKPAIHIAGKVQALDGKTQIGNEVMELVQPVQSPLGVQPTDRRTDAVNRAPFATSSVLNLPTDGSYAILPPNILAGLTEATIEGWTKWTGGQPPPKSYEVVFGFGGPDRGVWLGTKDRSMVEAGFELADGWRTVTVPQAIRTDEWIHWAWVNGPGGMKLFRNGVLAASRVETARLRRDWRRCEFPGEESVQVYQSLRIQ